MSADDKTVEAVAEALEGATGDNASWTDLARAAIEAHEAAKGEDDGMQRLARAAFAVDSKHHLWLNAEGAPTCLCGWIGDARARTQTEHITAAVIEEYDHD